MTSNVERKENDSDDDMYHMLEIYEQCIYIYIYIYMFITNQTEVLKTIYKCFERAEEHQILEVRGCQRFS